MSVALSVLNTIVDIFKYGWPFMILLVLIVAKIKGKNWPVDVIIIERRGENLIKTNDRAGKYYDKFTGLTGYKLLKSKDTIPVVEYDWVVHNMDKPTDLAGRISKFLRPTIGTLFLYRYGAKQYKPLKVDYNDGKDVIKELEMIKDKKGEPLLVERFQQFDPRGYLSALELEIVDWDNMNFMVQEIRASQERRKKKDAWLKTVLLPIAIIACATIVSIVMMKFSLDYAQTLKSPEPSTTQQETELPNIPIIGDAFAPK